MKQINAGKYNRKIQIISITDSKDSDGFKTGSTLEKIVLEAWAEVKTTKGYTLIQNNSDFEKAYTNFTIRYPNIEINRDMRVRYDNKTYTIEYLNNIDEENIELEIQAKVVVR